MRLHFQEKPWDLFAAMGYSVVIAAVLLALKVGNLFAVLLVLFTPGYAIVAALFPGYLTPEKPEIDWTERIALSFGLSIAVVPLLALLLNFSPFGIRFVPLVATITLFTESVGFVGYWRRMRLPTERRLSLTVELGLPDWKESSAVDKGLTVALAACIVIAGGTLLYVVLAPRPSETFTGFYIFGPGNNASGYPTALNVSQAGTVIVGIANHEAASVTYTLRVDLVGVKLVYNATSGFNETVEVKRTTWSMFNVALADGHNWTQPYTFRINDTGLWKIQFLLFKDSDLSKSYRELHLYVRVT